MPFDLHTVEVLDLASGSTGTSIQNQDKVVVGVQSAVANLIGGGAGQSVVTAVVFANELPASYAVHVTPNQDATAFVTAKTSVGFNVTLFPRLAANTLAAGTFDVLVVA
jgi:hypothetical protein